MFYVGFAVVALALLILYFKKLKPMPEAPESTPEASTTESSDSTPEASTTESSDSTPEASTTESSDSTPEAPTTESSESSPEASTTESSDSTPEASTTESSDSTPEASTTESSELPNNTEQSGKLYFYYALGNKAVHTKLQAFDDIHENNIREIQQIIRPQKLINFLFKKKFQKQLAVADLSTKVSDSLRNLIVHIQNIEQLREEDPDISIGNPMEYFNNKDLDLNLARERIKDLPKELYRSLFVIEWSVKIDLPQSALHPLVVGGEWEKNINVNVVTKRRGKRDRYTSLMKEFSAIIQRLVEFRKKHYTLMRNPIITNCLDENIIEFLQDLCTNYDDITSYYKSYALFRKTLSKRQRKKLERLQTANKFASVNININVTSQHAYDYHS